MKRLSAGASSQESGGEKNKPRLAETVIGPVCPAGIENSLPPLPGDVEPGGGVEFEIVAGRAAEPEKGSHDQQRNAERKKKSEPPATRRSGAGLVRKLDRRVHSGTVASWGIRDSRSATRRAAIISIDHAVFHDEEHLFGLTDVFERLALDSNDIRELAGFQRANLVL